MVCEINVELLSDIELFHQLSLLDAGCGGGGCCLQSGASVCSASQLLLSSETSDLSVV